MITKFLPWVLTNYVLTKAEARGPSGCISALGSVSRPTQFNSGVSAGAPELMISSLSTALTEIDPSKWTLELTQTNTNSLESQTKRTTMTPTPVSYTHLTLPTKA